MKQRTILLLALLFCPLLIIVGCLQLENSSSDDRNTYGEGFVDDGSNPNFAAVLAIIEQRCDTCHESHNFSKNTSEAGFLANGYYIKKGQANDSSHLYCRLLGDNCGIMPQSGPLSLAELNIFKTWIEEIE